MKFSYGWIRSLVDGLDVPAEALERLITMKTAECEGVETTGLLLADAVAATVESVEPIPEGHNVKAIVDAGRYGRKTVVCGASNCRTGIRTVYVPLGRKLVSGIESDGMLASAAELGINRDHEGIIELREGEEIPWTDSTIEIDNKSITHRPDLWGHHGMAREVAAITGKTLRDPVWLGSLPGVLLGSTKPPDSPVKIEIEDFSLCPRYSALVFENVTIQPSPLWIQARLTAVGLNPINNIVDLTNYIMAELAQPMHAFDQAKLNGDTIWARPAKEGESIVALNDEKYALTQSNLVIADAAGPIAIAGVIGGQGSAISDSTTSIVLESANFNAASVRKTSTALKLRTDASMRFEKAQDPHNTIRALARAVDLLPLVSPGARLVGGLADRLARLRHPEKIPLDLKWLARKLGRSLESDEVKRILESLQFGVAENGYGKFLVTVPSWRATKDVSMPEDLVEEVGRMIGYDSIEPKPPLAPCAPSFDPPEREFLRGVKRTLAARGFTEVSNYSFISEEEARRFGLAVEEHVRVLNPIAAGQELLRTSLLPGIHRNIVENAKHFDEFRIFEVGHEIQRADGKPEERQHLMAALFGNDGLLELKRIALCLAPELEIREASPKSWEHPARCAELWLDGRALGRLSEFHPLLVENGRASVVDIDLDLLRELTPALARYTPVRRFPTSAFDLSVLADIRVHAGDLEREIRSAAGDLAEDVGYVREYQGPPLPEGKKSVSFRVVAGAADHTLTADEITDLRNRIIAELNKLGYELRA
ncbi:MAG TPA: phenylalanine--tRNA ligase subunit beta [Bryobacteraceae bacterium]|nr:phenylalanine--tRNA ligase subunit beta [Bryobacteraceae bacterium]